jgi:hypothetical protein
VTSGHLYLDRVAKGKSVTITTQWIVVLAVAYWLASIGAMTLFFICDDERLERLGMEPASSAMKVLYYIMSPFVLGFAIVIAPMFGVLTIITWIIQATGRPRFLLE